MYASFCTCISSPVKPVQTLLISVNTRHSKTHCQYLFNTTKVLSFVAIFSHVLCTRVLGLGNFATLAQALFMIKTV